MKNISVLFINLPTCITHTKTWKYLHLMRDLMVAQLKNKIETHTRDTHSALKFHPAAGRLLIRDMDVSHHNIVTVPF